MVRLLFLLYSLYFSVFSHFLIIKKHFLNKRLLKGYLEFQAFKAYEWHVVISIIEVLIKTSFLKDDDICLASWPLTKRRREELTFAEHLAHIKQLPRCLRVHVSFSPHNCLWERVYFLHVTNEETEAQLLIK